MKGIFSFLILFTTILFVGAAPLFGQGTPPGGRGPTAAPLANIITNSTTTAVGVNALLENTTGFNNTAIGQNALLENTTGFGNIAIGVSAGSNQTTGSNNIYVANIGVAAESDTIRIGTVDTHTRTFIAGISGVTAAGTAVPVLIDTKGQLGTIPSSRRFKEEIRDMGETSSRIMQLRPVTFRYKKENGDGARPLQFGLIAEEVTEVYPGLVQYSATGEANAVLYPLLNAMLLNEVQKQHRQIKEQKERIADLTVRLVRLEALEADRDTFAVLTK